MTSTDALPSSPDRLLRVLYPRARTPAQQAELAQRLGVSVEAMRSRAKRMGIRRRRPPAFSAAQDLELAEAVLELGPEAGCQAAARSQGRTEEACALRWEELERARRARTGKVTELQLAAALADIAGGGTLTSAARASGADPDDLGLKLLALGVRRVHAADRELTVAAAARRLACGEDVLVGAVIDGALSARPPDGGGQELPGGRWVTSELRLGALLAAQPGRIDLSRADAAAVIRLSFHAGAAAAARMK